MCGIIGIFLQDENSNVFTYLLNGLNVLQHRGQDSAGIFTYKNNYFYSYKNNGKVNEVFSEPKLYSNTLIGNIGLGHVRYCTTGSLNLDQSQPLYTNSPYGIVLVHNGNIRNTKELKTIMIRERRHCNTDSDSELLLNLFALKLQKFNKLDVTILYGVVSEIYKEVKGSYSVILMINDFGLCAFKDPYGIRPLCFGKNEQNYMIASESVALDFCNYKLEREINAGECIIITKEGEFFNQPIINSSNLYPCLFEYIYFSRPESIINGIGVYEARKNMGEKLALKIKNEYPFIWKNIDVIMPIPESSRIPTLKICDILKKPYCEGFIKNSYIGRTFIMPNQISRKSNIKMKLNIIQNEFVDKNILIVDDSIVRGNTSIELIKMAKEAGAKKIYFGSVAPVVQYPNYYGISIPTKEELIAWNKTNSEIAYVLGAEYVVYNDLQDVIDSCNLTSMEASCFDGNYIV